MGFGIPALDTYTPRMAFTTVTAAGPAHFFGALAVEPGCLRPAVGRREPFLAPPNATSPAFSVDRSSETLFFDARTASSSFALARPVICRFSPVSAMI